MLAGMGLWIASLWIEMPAMAAEPPAWLSDKPLAEQLQRPLSVTWSKVPLDKAHIITFHVSGDIEQKKMELIKSVIDMKSVILLPRPWAKDHTRKFMQSEIAIFLKKVGIDTSNINTWVFENLTADNNKEIIFKGKVSDLEGKEFGELSVMVIDQVKRQTYLEFD